MLDHDSPVGFVGLLSKAATRSSDRADWAGSLAAPDGADGPRLAVLFDRDCGVCQETARTLRRWDHGRRLEFVPFQEAATSGRPLLERAASDRPLDEDLHVVDLGTGEIAVGGQAALAILDVLPGGWLLRPWSVLPSTTAAADVLYRLATRHRDTVGWLVGLRDEVACPAAVAAAGERGAQPSNVESGAFAR